MNLEQQYPTRSLLQRFSYYPTPLGVDTMRRKSERASVKKAIRELIDQLEGGDLFAVWHVANRLHSEAQANAKPKKQKAAVTSKRNGGQAKSH